MNTTIIFICIFYAIFAALVVYCKSTKTVKITSVKIKYAIFSLLLGWILFPIVVGESLK